MKQAFTNITWKFSNIQKITRECTKNDFSTYFKNLKKRKNFFLPIIALESWSFFNKYIDKLIQHLYTPFQFRMFFPNFLAFLYQNGY